MHLRRSRAGSHALRFCSNRRAGGNQWIGRILAYVTGMVEPGTADADSNIWPPKIPFLPVMQATKFELVINAEMPASSAWTRSERSGHAEKRRERVDLTKMTVSGIGCALRQRF